MATAPRSIRPSAPFGGGLAWLGVLSIPLVLLLWEAAIQLRLADPRLFGSPAGAFRESVRVFGEGRIWIDLGATMQALATGLALALLVGAPLGILLGTWRPGWTFLELPLFVLNALPYVALVPPLILTLGIGSDSKVALAFIAALIPIVYSGRTGAAGVPPVYVAAARVYGANRLDVFLKVILPHSLLSLLTGVRLGVGRALIAVLVGELYVSARGIGLWLSRAQIGLNADLLVFITLFVALIGAGLISAVGLLDRVFERWRD